jgi:hypothetical protein
MMLRISRVSVQLLFCLHTIHALMHPDEVVGCVAGRAFHVKCTAPTTHPVVDDLRRRELGQIGTIGSGRHIIGSLFVYPLGSTSTSSQLFILLQPSSQGNNSMVRTSSFSRHDVSGPRCGQPIPSLVRMHLPVVRP